jgi:PAS domain S-box-containing protein
MRFATKLALFFSGFFIIAGSVVVYSVSVYGGRILESAIIDKFQEQSSHTMDKIDRALYQRYQSTKMLKDSVKDLFWAPAPPTYAAISNTIRRFKADHTYFSSISVFDMQRRMIADTGDDEIGSVHALSEYWPEILAGDSFVSDIYFSERLKGASFHLSWVIIDKSGKATAVLVARIPPDIFNDIAPQAAGTHDMDKANSLSGAIKVDIADKNGRTVFSNHSPENILVAPVADWMTVYKNLNMGNDLGAEMVAGPNGEKELAIYTHEQGYRDFKGNNWTLVTHISEKQALMPVRQLRNKISIIIAISGGLFLLGIFVFSRTISKPIEALDRATSQISKGDFKLNLEIKSNDEFGHLAKSFNAMAERLSRTTKEIEQHNRHLKREIEVREVVEENLREVLTERDIVLETAKVGMALLVNRKVVWNNEYAAEIYGYTMEDWKNIEDVSVLYPSVEEFETTGMENLIVLAKGGIARREMINVRKDGGEIWVKLVGKAVDHDDLSKGVIWVIEDITDKKKAEQELRQAKENAEEATKLKDKFVSLVSHDLKSPLATILGLLKLAKENPANIPNEGTRKMIERAVDTGKQMSTLIEDLLNISRIRAGRVTLELRFMDARYVGSKMAADYQFSAQQKGIELTSLIPENSRIYCDKTLLTEAVQNLVTNAIKFCGKGDKITISLAENDKTTICVRDTGPGMPQAVVDNILGNAQNISTKGTAGETGSGLGLQLVNDIVELHGGELTAKCAEGKGCFFSLKLPRKRPVVLIVDDDPVSIEYQVDLLKLMDVEIMSAGNGQRALELMSGKRPHLVISDIEMPTMGGFELTETIKNNPTTKSIPVILISGQHGIEIKDSVFKKGADDFITKTLLSEDFIPRIRRFIG